MRIRILILSAVLLAIPLMAQAQPWSMYGGNPTHQGAVTDREFGSPSLAWIRSLGTPSSKVQTNLASDGRYVFFAIDQTVYCVDAVTGEQVASFSGGATITSPPAVYAGEVNRVIVGAQNGDLYGIQYPQMDRRWLFEADAAIHSPPTIAEGCVLFGTDGGMIYAVDAATGALRWRFYTKEPGEVEEPGAIRTAAAVWRGVVYISSTQGWLYALDLQTGGVKWRFPTRVLIWRPATTTGPAGKAGGGGLPGGAAGAAGAGSLGGGGATPPGMPEPSGAGGSGAEAGTARGVGTAAPNERTQSYSSPVLSGDTAYVAVGAFFYAIDIEQGLLRWRFSARGRILGTPAIDPIKRIVVIATSAGYVYALHSRTHQVLWEAHPEDEQFLASPVVIGNAVLLRSEYGTLYGYDLTSGQLVWQHKLPEGAATAEGGTTAAALPAAPGSAPIPVGQYVYTIGNDLNLYAFSGDSVDFTPPVALAGQVNIPGNDDNMYGYALGVYAANLAAHPEVLAISGRPPLYVVFRVWDEASGVDPSSIVVKQDGKVVKHLFRASDATVWYCYEPVGPTAQAMAPGPYEFTLSAADYRANQAEYKVAFTIDNTKPSPGAAAPGLGRAGKPPAGGRGGPTGGTGPPAGGGGMLY